ncbi:HEAT repeat domain-containing protein [Frateuria sp. GZRe12]|uniref:HEAT repeat domain-containing protein n=1 Tax=Frateuria sp. GZRe12 TaxID=3351533 RepID=UPI003EDBF874
MDAGEVLIASFMETICASPTEAQIEVAFAALVRKRVPEQFLDGEIRRIAVDGRYFSQGWRYNQLIMAESPFGTLSINSVTKPAKYAYTVDAETWVAVPLSAAADGLLVEHYEISEPSMLGSGEELSRSADQTVLRRGAVGKLKAGRVYRLIATIATPIMSFALPSSSNVIQKYDCETGRLCPSAHLQNGDMVLCSTARILGEFGDSQSFSALESLSHHSSHHVRWEAVTGMTKIDPMRAIEVLEALQSDEHPDIRAAAAITLERLLDAGEDLGP